MLGEESPKTPLYFMKKCLPMLNIPTVSSEIITVSGVWECVCQSYGGDIDG
jgi:hypothetical protein